MQVHLRAYADGDFDFARGLYFETMRSAIERHFGWDETHQQSSFARWFTPEEVSIITVDGADAGWIQQRQERSSIFLGSIYILPAMQQKGIGTLIITSILEQAEQLSLSVTLAVMKENPALNLYERLGFRITHQDDYKLYMTATPDGVRNPARKPVKAGS
jgi:ribosomal protein S18 acetylase RimI-like enzyme